MNLDFLRHGHGIEKFWNNEAMHFPDQKGLISSLPSINDLIISHTGSIISGKWTEPVNSNINASITKKDGSHEQLIAIDLVTARNCYVNGFSLCFGDLSSSILSLQNLKTLATDLFGYPDLIAVTAYLSPPNSTGVLHYDRQHNFFIQKDGCKRWSVSKEPAVNNPYENLVYSGLPQSFLDEMNERGYKIRLPKDCGRTTYVLEPGDVLYVPPGFYHSPETMDQPSLHYTLTIEPACFWKDFNSETFSKLLSSDGSLTLDYRFLSVEDKAKLFQDCINYIIPRSN